LTFVFTSDGSYNSPGFDISRISFRGSDLSEETVDVEITDGAGNYLNNTELRWNVELPSFFEAGNYFFLETVVAGRNYLHVMAVDNAGNSSEVAHYVLDVDPNPPLPVTEAVARTRNDDNIDITWSPVTDLLSGTQFYRIYRSTREGRLGLQINQDGSSRLAYTDWSRSNGGTAIAALEYFYTVRAVDQLGNENISDANIQVGSKSSFSLPIPDPASIAVEIVPVRLIAGVSGSVKIAGEFSVANAQIADSRIEIADGVITVELDTGWLDEERSTDWTVNGTIDALDQGRYPVRIVVNGTELDYEGEVNVVGPPIVVDGSLAVTVLPEAPQAGEEIILSVAGSFPSPDATLVGQSVTREDDTFLIELASAWIGDSGSNEAAAFDTTAGVGYLDAGQYGVTVQVNGDLLFESSFTVLGPPPEGPIALDASLEEGDQGERIVKGGAPGKVYELELNIAGAPELTGWSVVIEIDPDQVRFVDGSFAGGPFIPGLIGLSLVSETNFSVGGAVLGTGSNSGAGSLGNISVELLDGFSEQTTLRITEVSYRLVTGEAEIFSVSNEFVISSASAFVGDFDGNGKVDFSDFFVFADAFGSSDPTSDLNGDGLVDFSDFFIFADQFGKEEIAKLLALAAEWIGLPQSASLGLNYPNPFNLETTIPYTVGNVGPVSIRIYDVAGQLVRELVSQAHERGEYKAVWNGTNWAGSVVSSGMYLVRLRTDEHVEMKKVMLLK